MGNHLSRADYNRIVLESANRGAQIAIETHRRMGRSIVVVEGGQTKHIKATDIPPRALPQDEQEEDIGKNTETFSTQDKRAV